MVGPYRGAPAPHDARDAWIPLHALPVALREGLAAMGDGEPCESAAMRRSAGPPYGALGVAAGVCLIGLLTLASSPSATAFSLPTRWVPVLASAVTAATTATVLSMRRRGWWAPSRFHLGPTTLLTVSDGHVRVIPAERVEATADRIAFDGDVLDEGVHAPAWLDALGERIALARADANARATDPWRALAGAAPTVTRGGARRARATRVAAGALAGLAAGVFVEAVPLGIAGTRAVNAARAQREAASRAREQRLREATRQAQVLAEAARAERARLQAAALTGTEADARQWLRQATIADDEAFTARVAARLATFCAARYPDGMRVPERLSVYFVLLQRTCSDPEWRLFYEADEAYATLGAREVSRGLQEISDIIHQPLEAHPYAITEPDGEHPYTMIDVEPVESDADAAAEIGAPGLGTPDEDLDRREARIPMSMRLTLFDKNGERLGVPPHVERVTLVRRYERVLVEP